MKIPEKQFNKLSQLDRIEFRQKLDYCNIDMSIRDSIYLILILTAVFMVGGYGEVATYFLIVAFYLIICQIFFYIIGIFITSNRKRRLYEEYFKVGVRKK